MNRWQGETFKGGKIQKDKEKKERNARARERAHNGYSKIRNKQAIGCRRKRLNRQENNVTRKWGGIRPRTDRDRRRN